MAQLAEHFKCLPKWARKVVHVMNVPYKQMKVNGFPYLFYNIEEFDKAIKPYILRMKERQVEAGRESGTKQTKEARFLSAAKWAHRLDYDLKYLRRAFKWARLSKHQVEDAVLRYENRSKPSVVKCIYCGTEVQVKKGVGAAFVMNKHQDNCDLKYSGSINITLAERTKIREAIAQGITNAGKLCAVIGIDPRLWGTRTHRVVALDTLQDSNRLDPAVPLLTE